MATSGRDDPVPIFDRLSRRAMLKRAATFSGLTVLVAACGVPAAAPASEAEPTAAEPASIAASTAEVQPPIGTAASSVAERATIRFSSVRWGGWLSEPWQLLVGRFNESQTAVQIPSGYEDIAEGYQKVMAQAACGVAADVYTFETKYMPSFAARGFFVPLDEFVKNSTMVKKEAYFATDWEEMFWGGHQFMVPFDNSPAMIWYNRDLFKEAGVKPPPSEYGQWKWEDFLATAQRMTKGEGAEKVYGWAGERGWVYSLNWIWSNGGGMLNDEKTECVIDMPETVEALKWAAALVREHKVQPESAAIEQGGNSALFYSGRAAMAQKGTWWAIDLKAQEGVELGRRAPA